MTEKKILGVVFFFALCQSTIGTGQDFKVVGYLPTYRFYTIDDIELERITHLNIAFANPDASGNLTTDGVPIDAIVQKAHDAGVDVFISLAGGGAQLADWENWIVSGNRSSFISGIIDYVIQYDLQGVDVDLEWVTVNDDYSGFVVELNDSLDHYNLYLSSALPGDYRYPEITDEALAVFDWVNLMAYDMTGPWRPNDPGPHSPFSYAVNSIDYWISQGLDKTRMTLGVPFYGYDFTNPSNVTAFTFAEMVEIDPAYAQLDQVGSRYYNGLPTITQKTILAQDETSGIMIWELGQDYFGNLSLLKRIDETIKGITVTATVTQDKRTKTVIYPNPVSDLVHVKLDASKDVKVTLFSQSLRVLKIQHYSNREDISIDMRNYATGLYFLGIESETFAETFKLIKI